MTCHQWCHCCRWRFWPSESFVTCRAEDRTALRKLIKVQYHYKISPEVSRELDASRCCRPCLQPCGVQWLACGSGSAVFQPMPGGLVRELWPHGTRRPAAQPKLPVTLSSFEQRRRVWAAGCGTTLARADCGGQCRLRGGQGCFSHPQRRDSFGGPSCHRHVYRGLPGHPQAACALGSAAPDC